MNFGPLIKHGPNQMNFTTFIVITENNRYLDAYIKFGTKLFHLT